MSIRLLTEQCLELLSLKGCCTGFSEARLVKMPRCWKSCVMAHFLNKTQCTYLWPTGTGGKLNNCGKSFVVITG